MRTTGSSTGRRTHRLQVRFDNRVLGDVRNRAALTGESLSSVVRQLVATALGLDADLGPRPDSPAALAALVAAEQAALMVAAVLPDGRRRMQDLTQEAVAAAEQRLALFREEEG